MSEFGAALHEMLSDADVTAVARSWARGDLAPGLALWRGLAELGVTALAVPEQRGGLGASPADLVVACEELGHHAVPGPVAESLAAVPVLLAGAAVGGEWLGALADGDLIATLAAPPGVPLAPGAEVAGLVLLVVDGVLSAGRPGEWYRSVDPARSLAEVRGGRVLAGDVAEAAGRAAEFGTLACAAQLLGAGRALLEASVRHASVREQFGRPVGTFQAVKHRLADVAIGLEFARPLLDAAALALGEEAAAAGRDGPAPGRDGPAAGRDGSAAGRDGPAVRRDVSAAKVACADAAYRAARAALQVHGAIGYTAEHQLSRWLVQVRALVPAWGGPAEHRARVLRELG
ncbi:MAG TPA: acyl-CoA dehydrogenase family protein [Streptosporangiaceae bacterium]|nr:acyl-CoA dehydrogenase family protein [Streptosporangiaceae bacterium]